MVCMSTLSMGVETTVFNDGFARGLLMALYRKRMVDA